MGPCLRQVRSSRMWPITNNLQQHVHWLLTLRAATAAATGTRCTVVDRCIHDHSIHKTVNRQTRNVTPEWLLASRGPSTPACYFVACYQVAHYIRPHQHSLQCLTIYKVALYYIVTCYKVAHWHGRLCIMLRLCSKRWCRQTLNVGRSTRITAIHLAAGM